MKEIKVSLMDSLRASVDRIKEAKDVQERSLTLEAERASEVFKQVTKWLNDVPLTESFMYLEDEETPDWGLVKVGIGWSGSRLVTYFSEEDSDKTPEEMSSLIGANRSIRVEGLRMLPKLLDSIEKTLNARLL